MPVVSKKKPVAVNTTAAEKKITTTATTTAAPAKKTVAAPVAKTAAPAKKTVAAPAKKTTATTTAAPAKKISLTNKAPKAPKSFEIKEGSQATQEAFIDIFYKKLLNLSYDVTKEQTKSIKKAYSETLKEVTDIASYQDVDAGIFYARRYIESRVTAPPKARHGFKTLMNGHYELKVRKLLGNEEEFKFFGDLNEDGTIFIAQILDENGDPTGETQEVSITDGVEVEVKPATVKKQTKKAAPVVVEEDEEEVVEEDIVEEDADEEDLEIEEELEEELAEDDEDLSEFFDDED